MRKVRIGINGFGRIGRIATRIALACKTVEVVAINSRADTASHAYLLKYDSSYGVLPNKVMPNGNQLRVDSKTIHVYQQPSPELIPWKQADIDVVLEATGSFRQAAEAELHLQAGARHVIVTAPPKDDIPTFCLGVNDETLNPAMHHIISNASCTTNCLAVVCKVLDDAFGIVSGFMTTTHAYTDSQNLLDNSHKKDRRLSRAAALSMIPTTTGASKALDKVLPRLAGKIISSSLRVPVPSVSLVDLTVNVKKTTSKENVNTVFEKAAKAKLKGILSLITDPVVSVDLKGDRHSAIVDSLLTEINGKNMINVKAWYDNEWGYCARLIDLAERLGQ